MILFVDETENEECFIVAGLLVNSKADVDVSYRHFKKKVSNYKLAAKTKQRVFKEFKATTLDTRFQGIKKKLLMEISTLNGSIVYSCYIKKDAQFNQILKEATYIVLLSKIVATVDVPIDVIFDSFRKDNFETDIVAGMMAFNNVSSIQPCKSELEPGLQYIDNICSVLRRHKSGIDEDHFYEIIENMVTEV